MCRRYRDVSQQCRSLRGVLGLVLEWLHGWPTGVPDSNESDGAERRCNSARPFHWRIWRRSSLRARNRAIVGRRHTGQPRRQSSRERLQAEADALQKQTEEREAKWKFTSPYQDKPARKK